MRRALVIALTLLAVGVSSAASAGGTRAGTLTTAKAGPIDYTVYLPYGYSAGRNAKVRYPVLYLLHGRGDTMQAWTRIKADLDKLIDDGTIAPVIAVLPDAPWSERGSWYVDSAYDHGSGDVFLTEVTP
jgi:enterochelin esterase-like enzyme